MNLLDDPVGFAFAYITKAFFMFGSLFFVIGYSLSSATTNASFLPYAFSNAYWQAVHSVAAHFSISNFMYGVEVFFVSEKLFNWGVNIGTFLLQVPVLYWFGYVIGLFMMVLFIYGKKELQVMLALIYLPFDFVLSKVAK